MRITSVHVAEVKRLRKAHWSQNAIAKHTGICRHTIRGILAGHYNHLQCDWSPTPERKRDFIQPATDDPRLVKCDICGGKVLPPCGLCETREIKRRMKEERKK